MLTRMDLEEDGYRRQIHLHDGESVQQFTTGQIDGMPRWSPDGKQLAFLRATDVKKPIPQLALMPVAGGEARVLTKFDLGVEYLSWSPDGRWICGGGQVMGTGTRRPHRRGARKTGQADHHISLSLRQSGMA